MMTTSSALLSSGLVTQPHRSFDGVSLRRRLACPGSRQGLRVQSMFSGKEEDGKNKNPFSNFGELLKKAEEARSKAAVEAQRLQEELSGTEFDGYDSEETVKVIISGNQEPRAVELTESAMACEPEELSNRLVEAMRDAHQKSVSGMKDRMKELYQRLGLPMSPQI